MRLGAPARHWSVDIPVRQSLANHAADRNVRAPSFVSLLLGAFALGLLLPPPALAQDTITNVMSPVASYQYYDAPGESTNTPVASPVVSWQFYDLLGGSTNVPVVSPIASFQFYDSLIDLGTNSVIVSPIVSYQYFEWPGDGILRLVNSPVASYWYGSGVALPGVSANLSQVVASPGSLAADGQAHATVTVTLLDGNGNPVPGKRVSVSVAEQLSSGRATTLSNVTQPASLTDNNGQATASFTSTAPGTAIISAQDTTDGVALSQPATVRFTSGYVVPSSALSDAIVQLANSSSNLLTHSIASAVTDEGGYADYFWQSAGEDAISMGTTVLDSVASGMLEAMSAEGGGEAQKELILEATKAFLVSVGHDLTVDTVEGSIGILASSSSGLTTYAQTISANNTSLRQAETSAAQGLLSGVPPAAANYAAGYVTDLGLRMQANAVLGQVVSSQHDLVNSLKVSSGYSHTTLLKWLFVGVDVTTAAAGVLVPAAKPLIAGIGVGEADVQLSSAARSLAIDQQGYNSAFISLAGSSYLSSVLDANTEAGFNAIALGQQPAPVMGSILSVDSKRLYVPARGIFGSIARWVAQAVANTLEVDTVGAYSTVTIKNTGLLPEQFGVYAFFANNVDLINDAGWDVGSTTVPIVLSQTTSIPGGQSVEVTFDYFNHPAGGMPDANSQITYYVVGYDGKGGVFWVGQTSSTMQWQRASGNSVAPPVHPNGPIPRDDTNNVVSVETLITSLVCQNPTNQTYQAQVWVVNSFAVPLLAKVTQPLPPGVAVVSTDGVLEGNSILWTNAIATNGLAEQSFSFTLAMPPGAKTNLPPPTLVFTDDTGTNSLTQTATAASFIGLFPVGVSSVVPGGTWGTDTPAQVAVTNYTAASQSGSLAISVADANGTVVASFSLPFSVGSLAGRVLTYTLPGTLPPGEYAVSGLLSMGGGSAQVFSGTYVVSALTGRLICGSAVGALTDGFTLGLQGTAGYGYLVEASTNLLDWQPIQYLVLAGSPTYFTDYYAPYYNQRFYRALPVGQVAVQVPPQFGAVRLVSGGGVQFTLMGGVGQAYTVQASTNLVNWVAITNLVLATGSGQFTDYPVTNCPQRFYRALVP